MTRELDERGKNHRIQAYVIPSTEKRDIIDSTNSWSWTMNIS